MEEVGVGWVGECISGDNLVFYCFGVVIVILCFIFEFVDNICFV